MLIFKIIFARDFQVSGSFSTILGDQIASWDLTGHFKKSLSYSYFLNIIIPSQSHKVCSDNYWGPSSGFWESLFSLFVPS